MKTLKEITISAAIGAVIGIMGYIGLVIAIPA